MTFAKKKKKKKISPFEIRLPPPLKCNYVHYPTPDWKKKGLKNPKCPIIEGVNDSLMGGKIGISTFLSFCSIR